MDDRVYPWQRLLAPGTYVLRVAGEMPRPLFTYCEVLDEDAPHGYEADADLVLVRSYHAGSPDGERGHAHRASLYAPMSPAQFDAARRLCWPNRALAAKALINEVPGGDA